VVLPSVEVEVEFPFSSADQGRSFWITRAVRGGRTVVQLSTTAMVRWTWAVIR
jgi:hypothetical protein